MKKSKFRLPRRSLRARKPDGVDQAVAHLQELAVSFAERPLVGGEPSNPQMPEDITEISDVELGRLHGKYNAYLDWLEDQAAYADGVATDQAAYLNRVKAEVRLLKSGTVADKDAKVLTDERVIAAEDALFEAQARKQLLRARVRGCEKCANALSREQTRREKAFERSSRA